MNALDAVYEQNNKRLAESRAAQKAGQPQWQKDYLGTAPKAPAPYNPQNYTSPQPQTPYSILAPMRESRPSAPNTSGYVGGVPGQQQPGEVRPDGKKAAMGFWQEQNQAWNKANEDTLVDRGAMLSELADFKAKTVLSRQNMEMQLANTEEKLKLNTTEILDRVRNNFASMGRAASPYMMAELSKRLALQNKDKLNSTRSQLELDSAQIHSSYLGMLEQTLAGTKRSVMDPAMVMAMMEKLGAGSASTPMMGGGINRAPRNSGGGGMGNKPFGGGMDGGRTMKGDPNAVANFRAARNAGTTVAGGYRPGLNDPKSGGFVTNNAYKINQNAGQQAGQGYDDYSNQG